LVWPPTDKSISEALPAFQILRSYLTQKEK